LDRAHAAASRPTTRTTSECDTHSRSNGRLWPLRSRRRIARVESSVHTTVGSSTSSSSEICLLVRSSTNTRDYVKKRKVSGGTRGDVGRQCRDTFIIQTRAAPRGSLCGRSSRRDATLYLPVGHSFTRSIRAPARPRPSEPVSARTNDFYIDTATFSYAYEDRCE
jgi:hypothetical protein